MGHCCACSVVCHHIGGPVYCDAHKPTPAGPGVLPAVPITDLVVIRRRSDSDREAYLAAKVIELMVERDEARASLRRVRILAEELGGLQTRAIGNVHLVAVRLRAALDGTDLPTDKED